MPKLDDMPIGSLSVAQIAEYLDERADVDCLMVLWVQQDRRDQICSVHVGDSTEDDYDGHQQLLSIAFELVAEYEAEAYTDGEKEA